MKSLFKVLGGDCAVQVETKRNVLIGKNRERAKAAPNKFKDGAAARPGERAHRMIQSEW